MDHQTTTPVDHDVLEAMMPYLTEQFGDPSSRSHAWGWAAEEAVDRAREQVASLIGAHAGGDLLHQWRHGVRQPGDQRRLPRLSSEQGRHIVTQQTEHRAILDSCRRLEPEGFTITYLPVDRYGLGRPGSGAAGAYHPDNSGQHHARQQRGWHHPTVGGDRQMVKARGILFHSDAVQTVGKIACQVDDLQLDLMSISAHKMYGPKGVGALYVRKTRPRRIKMTPLVDGGGHERGLRSGSLNVPGIVGLGKACEVCRTPGAKKGNV